MIAMPQFLSEANTLYLESFVALCMIPHGNGVRPLPIHQQQFSPPTLDDQWDYLQHVEMLLSTKYF